MTRLSPYQKFIELVLILVNPIRGVALTEQTNRVEDLKLSVFKSLEPNGMIYNGESGSSALELRGSKAARSSLQGREVAHF